MKANGTDSSNSHGNAGITLSLVIVVILAFLFLMLPPDEYTMTVQDREWTVKNNVAQRLVKNGSPWIAGGGILANHIYFPFDSTDRVIEIDLYIVDGTIDLLIFPNIGEYQRYQYSSISDGVLASWSNITEIFEIISLEDRTPIIVYRSYAGGATISGSVIATCNLN